MIRIELVLYGGSFRFQITQVHIFVFLFGLKLHSHLFFFFFCHFSSCLLLPVILIGVSIPRKKTFLFFFLSFVKLVLLLRTVVLSQRLTHIFANLISCSRCWRT